MKKIINKLALLNIFTIVAFAQEETVAGAEETSKFLQIVGDNAPVGPLIWILLFSLSAASFAAIIDNLLSVRRKTLLPQQFIDDALGAMEEGDLDMAIEFCEKNNSPISNILLSGFANIDSGFESIEAAVDSTTQVEVEKLTQKVGLLNLYGQLAPMLGLLGTVTGMVSAFDGLANTEGAEKAKKLGLAISQALWTTCAGLLIAIPAIFAFTMFKNKAIKILLESETIVVDFLKDLRNVEIEEN